MDRKLLCAYRGKNVHLCFLGKEKVGEIHVIEGWYSPSVTTNQVTRFGRWLKTPEAAKAWILMALREMRGKTK